MWPVRSRGTSESQLWGDCGTIWSSCVCSQAQVTGSTLNGRKEKLQATEEDKEKWGFLQFAEAWTPSDSCEELSKGAVFTHVRDFFFYFLIYVCFICARVHVVRGAFTCFHSKYFVCWVISPASFLYWKMYFIIVKRNS